MKGLLRKLRVTPGGFLLLSGLLFFLDWGMLFAVLGNVLLHEYGHLWMLRRMGVYVRSIELGAGGLNIRCNLSLLPPLGVALCAAAGPGAGILGGLVSSVLGNALSVEGLFLFAGVGFVLSVFNLLPAGGLDGWRIVHGFSPRLAHMVGQLTSMVVLIVGICLMYSGYGTALAVMGLVLLARDMRKTDRCI